LKLEGLFLETTQGKIDRRRSKIEGSRSTREKQKTIAVSNVFKQR